MCLVEIETMSRVRKSSTRLNSLSRSDAFQQSAMLSLVSTLLRLYHFVEIQSLPCREEDHSAISECALSRSKLCQQAERVRRDWILCRDQMHSNTQQAYVWCRLCRNQLRRIILSKYRVWQSLPPSVVDIGQSLLWLVVKVVEIGVLYALAKVDIAKILVLYHFVDLQSLSSLVVDIFKTDLLYPPVDVDIWLIVVLYPFVDIQRLSSLLVDIVEIVDSCHGWLLTLFKAGHYWSNNEEKGCWLEWGKFWNRTGFSLVANVSHC